MSSPEDCVLYLDYAATTPCRESVVAAMQPWFRQRCGNTSNNSHAFGKDASNAVDAARDHVAKLVGATCGEQIVFTSGATEANNLVIRGLADAVRHGNPVHAGRNRILVSQIEHRAVIRPAEAAEKDGFVLDWIPVDHNGVVDLAALESLLDESVLLVAVHAANNEIGTLQPIEQIVSMSHKVGARVLCDCAQITGKLPINLAEWKVDYASHSAHKLYGPQGIGALFCYRGAEDDGLEPQLLGGGQERCFRSGTLNVPGIVGFGETCRIALDAMEAETAQIAAARDRFERRITESGDSMLINCCDVDRIPGLSSITVFGIDGDKLIDSMPELAISRGSACSTGANKPSHVLTAIGINEHDAYSTLRICMGSCTTLADADRAADILLAATSRLRGATAATA